MNISEQNARKLQEFHFRWNEKNKEFYSDYGLSGNNYKTIYFDPGLNQWVLYYWNETENGEDYESFADYDSLEQLIEEELE